MKLLLFDIDGTILLTGGAGVRGMEEAGVMLFGERFSLQGISVSGGLDPLIYAEATAVAGIENAHTMHDRFRETYLRQLHHNLRQDADKVRLCPGIGQLIRDLRGHNGNTLGLVTGNYTGAVPIKLHAVGLDPEWFPIHGFGDEANDRPAMVRLAVERFAKRTGRPVNPRDVIIIGDTPHDVSCAHANGCVCLAVATGMFSVDQLKDAGADIVVADLSDPQPLWDLVESV